MVSSPSSTSSRFRLLREVAFALDVSWQKFTLVSLMLAAAHGKRNGEFTFRWASV